MNRQEAVRRATELVEQMSVEELASQLRFDADEIPHLDIPEYSSAVKNGPCRNALSCTARKRSAGTGPCPKACPESCRPYHFSSIREA